MFEGVAGFAFGIAAHQTHLVVSKFKGNWSLLTRYIIGYLTCGLVAAMFIKRLRPDALRDAMLAFMGAGVSVGLGVAAGMFIDESH